MILLILACSDQNSSESKPKETAPAVQKSTQRFPQHTAKGPLQKPSGRPLGRPPQHGNNQHHPPSGGHVSKSIKLEPNFSWSSDDLVSEQQRSIVLISLDTVRADYLSVYGGSAQVAEMHWRFCEGPLDIFNSLLGSFRLLRSTVDGRSTPAPCSAQRRRS